MSPCSHSSLSAETVAICRRSGGDAEEIGRAAGLPGQVFPDAAKMVVFDGERRP